MQYFPEILRAFSQLLGYPDDRIHEHAEFLYVAVPTELPTAATDISAFGRFAEQCGPGELEELYATTFDVNPPCALEVGWHLFGEEYARGQFLVRMREELRRYGIAESAELPDHITHVLAVVAAMPDDEARRLAQACLLPALEKMQDALDAADSPYAGIIRSLAQVLRHRWPHDGNDAEERYQRTGAGRTDGVDLLHAFPVADVPFFDPAEHVGCGSALDIVPLELSFHTGGRTAEPPLPLSYYPRPTPER